MNKLYNLPLLMLMAILLVLSTVSVNATSSGQTVLSCTSPDPNAGMNPATSCHGLNLPGTFNCPTHVMSPTGQSVPVVFCASNIGGFWIWCETSSTNPYSGQCSGDLYLFEIPGGYEHITMKETSPSLVTSTSQSVSSANPSNPFTCVFSPSSSSTGPTGVVGTACDGTVSFTSNGPMTTGVVTIVLTCPFFAPSCIGGILPGFHGNTMNVVVNKT